MIGFFQNILPGMSYSDYHSLLFYAILTFIDTFHKCNLKSVINIRIILTLVHVLPQIFPYAFNHYYSLQIMIYWQQAWMG